MIRSRFPYAHICGAHLHIGSQITESTPYIAAIRKMIRFIKRLKTGGITLEYLNIGGGLGIIYDKEAPQTADNFARKILPLLKETRLKIIMEPGRFIVGNAGILVVRVLYLKSTPVKKFVIVDGGMNDLIRPALYDAYHTIVPLSLESVQRRTEKVDIVGPICESGDFFAKERLLPRVKEGSFLAIMSAGAYGFSMSSNYNTRPRAMEVLIHKNKMHIIRDRETYNDLIRREKAVSL